MVEELKRFAIGATITAIVWAYALCAHADEILIKPYYIKVVYGQDAEKPDIQIVDSTRIVDRQNMVAILKVIMAHPYYTVVVRNRNLASYLHEWRSHNYMFDVVKKQDRKERLGAVDFEENEAKWKLYAYPILSLMYGPHYCDSMTCPGYEPIEVVEIKRCSDEIR